MSTDGVASNVFFNLYNDQRLKSIIREGLTWEVGWFESNLITIRWLFIVIVTKLRELKVLVDNVVSYRGVRSSISN